MELPWDIPLLKLSQYDDEEEEDLVTVLVEEEAFCIAKAFMDCMVSLHLRLRRSFAASKASLVRRQERFSSPIICSKAEILLVISLSFFPCDVFD